MERLEDRTAPSDTLGTLLGGTFLALPALTNAGPLSLFGSIPTPQPQAEPGPSALPQRTTPANEPPISPRRSPAATNTPTTTSASAPSAMQNAFGGMEKSEPSRPFAGLSADERRGLLASVLATDFSARPRRPAAPELPEDRPAAAQTPPSTSSGGAAASAPSGSSGGGGPVAGSPVAPPAQGSGETLGSGSAAPDKSSQGLMNLIVMQFTVSPPGIGDEPGILFDITRRTEGTVWRVNADGSMADDPKERTFPLRLDEANDDLGTTDETDEPNENDHMYVMDAPGSVSDGPIGTEIRYVFRANFEEYLRIDLGGNDPSGNTIFGSSRASDKFLWHTRHWADVQGGTWVRSTGDANESVENDIAGGHITVGDEP